MAIPDQEEARRILAARHLTAGIIRHSEGVARVAREAARIIAGAGIPLDVDLVEVAALLHDIDKPQTGDGRGIHGEVAAAMLASMGFGELASAVASHPVTALLDDARFPRGWPAVIVSVADKHVAQEFLGIDERLAEMAERHPAYREQIMAARKPALALEQEVAEAGGMEVSDLVQRLRDAWRRDDDRGQSP